MIKTKVSLSIILMITILLGTISPVFAADYTFSLTVNPQTVTAELGDTISIDLGIADIDQSTEGINAIQGDISFSEDLFESINLVNAGNNWSVSYNNSVNSELSGRFVLSNMSNVKDTQVVAKLVAKIKSDATVTEGTIILNEVYSSYGSNQTDKKTKTITVNIQSSSSTDEEDNTNNTIIDDGSNNTVTPTPSTSTKTDSSTTQGTTKQSTTTSSKSVLPKAGIVSWIGIVIVAIVIVAVIELIKYKRIMK